MTAGMMMESEAPFEREVPELLSTNFVQSVPPDL